VMNGNRGSLHPFYGATILVIRYVAKKLFATCSRGFVKSFASLCDWFISHHMADSTHVAKSIRSDFLRAILICFFP